ncbi:hypothetical protein RFI_25686 [Reticulomyxa filosa]|uniref:Uncharacterized protein n=1 Tax=Reticulomyxa filosa TaxID=46433 RepID=X6MF67_RETFI|nr:hypothetical protein RFI_25686 [Reticulomyxa filosa]|eukprot:ETO11690.1 hypothetical protein RFI_25686 [Reticulomyxa filosa]
MDQFKKTGEMEAYVLKKGLNLLQMDTLSLTTRYSLLRDKHLAFEKYWLVRHGKGQAKTKKLGCHTPYCCHYCNNQSDKHNISEQLRQSKTFINTRPDAYTNINNISILSTDSKNNNPSKTMHKEPVQLLEKLLDITTLQSSNYLLNIATKMSISIHQHHVVQYLLQSKRKEQSMRSMVVILLAIRRLLNELSTRLPNNMWKHNFVLESLKSQYINNSKRRSFITAKSKSILTMLISGASIDITSLFDVITKALWTLAKVLSLSSSTNDKNNAPNKRIMDNVMELMCGISSAKNVSSCARKFN